MIFYKLLCHLLLLLLICGIASFTQLHGQSIIFVDSSVASSGNGISWNGAYKTVQEALDATETAAPPVQIWVKKGTYYPTTYPKNCTDYRDEADKTLLLPNGVAIYGGFAGNERSLAQRNSSANLTILSGDIGVKGDSTDNCHHIMLLMNNTDTCTVDGFTFTKGNAYTGGYITVGGYQVTSLTGGAINNYYSPLKVSNCQFLYNTANAACGIHNYYGAFTAVDNCSFTYNNGIGGAPCILSYYGYAAITNCVFGYNQGHGSVYNDNSTHVKIDGCVFTNNTGKAGAAILNNECSPRISNCLFVNNVAYATGHATGGAMCNIYGSSPVVTNCTFVNNSSSYYGGAIYNNMSSPTFSNCIVWGNKAAYSGNNIADLAGSYSGFTYSVVESSYAGPGNLDVIPQFVDTSNAAGPDHIWKTADDGLRLKCSSPALNIGSNTAVANIATDIAGDSRIQNGVVDAGAYESAYNGTPLVPSVTIGTTPGLAFCKGASITFTATPVNGGTTPAYEWQRNGATVAGIVSNSYTVDDLNDGDQISVILTSSESCVSPATATDNEVVTVYPLPGAPVIAASGNTTFCEGGHVDIVMLSAAAGIAYRWNTAATTRELTATASGTYHVSMQNANGCWGPVSNDVVVNAVPYPVFTISSDNGTSLVRGASTRLTASNTAGTIAWTPADGLAQPTAFTTVAKPLATTTYTATVTNAGCATSHAIIIEVLAPIDSTITTNKILTPNGDGINDYLVVDHIEWYPDNLMQVFDRAGKLVYEKRYYRNEWNGLVNNRPFITDNYFFVFTVSGKVARKGSITVLIK